MHFRILLTIFLFLCLGLQQTAAQSDSTQINGLKVGIVPSALLNIFAGFQVKATYTFLDKYNIQANYGILNGEYSDRPLTGHRIRIGFRYYPKWEYENLRLYFEGGYLRRRIKSQFTGQYEDLDENITTAEVKTNGLLTGGYFQFGSVLQLSNRISLDYGIGVGQGNLTNLHMGAPENQERVSPRDVFFGAFDISIDEPFPILIFHFAFTYQLTTS